jgi:hypothetical protein
VSAVRIFSKFQQLLDVSWGNIADGQYLKRSGVNITGVTPGLPKGTISGCGLAMNGVDAVNDIDIGSGACRSDDDLADITLTTGLTKQSDAAWAPGNNVGGRDTGVTADGWWYVYAIKNPTTGVSDVIFTLTRGSPTMPSGFTLKKRLGQIRRVSGAIRSFGQRGDRFIWSNATQDATIGPFSNGQLGDYQCANSVPPFRTRVTFNFSGTCTTSSSFSVIQDSDLTVSGAYNFITVGVNDWSGGTYVMFNSSTGFLKFKNVSVGGGGAVSGALTVLDYEDDRSIL